MEGMDILQTRKAIEDEGNLLTKRFLCEFDLSRVKVSDSRDSIFYQYNNPSKYRN